MAQLAEALSTIESALLPIARAGMERRDEEMTQEGAAEAQRLIEEDALSFREAVKEGVISDVENPWRRLGMLRTFGEVEGDRYANELRAFMQERVLAGAVDVENFADAEMAFRRQWVEERIDPENRDGAFEAAFAQRVNAASRSVGAQFAQQAGIESAKRRLDGAYETIQGNLDSALDAGIDFTNETEVRSVVAREIARADELVQVEGLDGTLVNETLVDAVIDRAVAEGDPNILELIEQSPLANTRHARESLADAVVQINKAVNAERQFSEGQRLDRGRAFLDQLAIEAADDSQLVIENRRQIMKDASALGPDVAAGAERIIDVQLGVEGVSNPGTLADLSIAVANGTATDREIEQARQAGALSKQDAADLLITKHQMEGQGGETPFRDDVYPTRSGLTALIAGAGLDVQNEDPALVENVRASIDLAWQREYRDRNLAEADYSERSRVFHQIVEDRTNAALIAQREGRDASGRALQREIPRPDQIDAIAEQGAEAYLQSGAEADVSPSEGEAIEDAVNRPPEDRAEPATGAEAIQDGVIQLYDRIKRRDPRSVETRRGLLDDQIERLEERLEGNLGVIPRLLIERQVRKLRERRDELAPSGPASEPTSPPTGTVEPEASPEGDLEPEEVSFGDDQARFMDALAEIESTDNYDARGPVVPSGRYKGERAAGRYQIMPGNLPTWSRQAVGRSVSVDAFMADPALQDQIAGYHIARLFRKYKDWGAVAVAWHAGENAARRWLKSGNSGARDLATGLATNDYAQRVLARMS